MIRSTSWVEISNGHTDINRYEVNGWLIFKYFEKQLFLKYFVSS